MQKLKYTQVFSTIVLETHLSHLPVTRCVVLGHIPGSLHVKTLVTFGPKEETEYYVRLKIALVFCSKFPSYFYLVQKLQWKCSREPPALAVLMAS